MLVLFTLCFGLLLLQRQNPNINNIDQHTQPKYAQKQNFPMFPSQYKKCFGEQSQHKRSSLYDDFPTPPS